MQIPGPHLGASHSESWGGVVASAHKQAPPPPPCTHTHTHHQEILVQVVPLYCEKLPCKEFASHMRGGGGQRHPALI